MDLSNTITETLQNINISKTDEKIKNREMYRIKKFRV